MIPETDKEFIARLRRQLELDHPLSVADAVFLLAQIDRRDEALRFYAGHSKSDAKRLLAMDGGALARKVLGEE